MRPVATSARCGAGPRPPPAAESSRPGIYGRRWMLFAQTHTRTNRDATHTYTHARVRDQKAAACNSVRPCGRSLPTITRERARTDKPHDARRTHVLSYVFTRARRFSSIPFRRLPTTFSPGFSYARHHHRFRYRYDIKCTMNVA